MFLLVITIFAVITNATPLITSSKLFRRGDGGKDACQVGNYTPSVNSWREQNVDDFLRHWWQCASGQLNGVNCVPLNGALPANNTNDTGLSIDVSYTVTNTSVSLNVTNEKLPTAINSSLPVMAQNGLTAALVGQYAPSVNNFVCDIHHDCKFPSCTDLNWDKDDNWRAYQVLVSIGWVNDVFKQTYDALNEAQVRMLAQSPVIAEKFTTAGIPDDERHWVTLESLNNALVGVAVLGLNFAPEMATFLYGAKMFTVSTESFINAAAKIEPSSLARARNILVTTLLGKRRAAMRQVKEDIQMLDREAKDLDNVIAKWNVDTPGSQYATPQANTPQAITPQGNTPQARGNPVFSPIQEEGTVQPIPAGEPRTPSIDELRPTMDPNRPSMDQLTTYGTAHPSVSELTSARDEFKARRDNLQVVLTAIRQSGRVDPTQEQIQTIMANANPGVTMTNVISPTLSRRIVDFVGKSSGVLPSLTGSIAFALSRGTSTMTIDSLANFASITDEITTGIKTWLAEENANLLKGLHDSNGFYLWDWIQDARFIQPHTNTFDNFKSVMYNYFVAQNINAAIKLNRSFIYGFNRTIYGHTHSCEDIHKQTIANAAGHSLMDDIEFADKKFQGPWQTLFCDERYPLFFHMYRIPDTDPLGILKQRLAIPTGLESLGQGSNYSLYDPASLEYNISIVDIMNSSVQAYYAARNHNTTDYNAIRQQRWLVDFKDNRADLLADTPSYEGVFNIPVCASSSRHGAFKAYEWFVRPWPCHCGINGYYNETDGFKDVWYNYISEREQRLCDDQKQNY